MAAVREGLALVSTMLSARWGARASELCTAALRPGLLHITVTFLYRSVR